MTTSVCVPYSKQFCTDSCACSINTYNRTETCKMRSESRKNNSHRQTCHTLRTSQSVQSLLVITSSLLYSQTNPLSQIYTWAERVNCHWTCKLIQALKQVSEDSLSVYYSTVGAGPSHTPPMLAQYPHIHSYATYMATLLSMHGSSSLVLVWIWPRVGCCLAEGIFIRMDSQSNSLDAICRWLFFVWKPEFMIVFPGSQIGS